MLRIIYTIEAGPSQSYIVKVNGVVIATKDTYTKAVRAANKAIRSIT